MKRYAPFVPSYSGHANFEEDKNGKWVKYADVEEALKESYRKGYDQGIADDTEAWQPMRRCYGKELGGMI